MSLQESLPRYTIGEEIANGITHGIGVILAIAALATMIGFAAQRGDTQHIVACSIFGGALIFTYTASTIYHSTPLPTVKFVFRTLDHSAIFVLIAGTYTPFMLIGLPAAMGWQVLATIWLLAILGIVLRLVWKGRRHKIIVSLYISMGWIIVLTFKPMSEHVPMEGVVLLAEGGIAYMVGVAFYLWRRLRYHHAIWHVFVLLGSSLHFFAVLFYLIP